MVDTVANATATPRWRLLKPASPERARRLGDGQRALKNASYELRTKALADAQRRGDVVELDQHELLRLLESPHPEFTGRALRKLMLVNLDLPGETFLWLQRDAGGRVVGMLVLPTHCVQTTPTKGSPFFLVTYNPTVVQVPQVDMKSQAHRVLLLLQRPACHRYW